MTHLDLCTGIGGFHLAAQWTGFETIGFSEIDPYCCALLKEKWPQIKNYGDLRTTDFSGLRGGVTVLSAGVPCQPASVAGKRRGANDDRWLWGAVLNVVGAVEPAWCIFENPPGILTLDEFGGVLLRLESLGYAVRLFSVPANAVGAKHRRQRVFIVAHAGCEYGAYWERWKTAIGERTRANTERSGEDAEALADTDLKRCGEARQLRSEQSQDQERISGSGQAMADADSPGWGEPVPTQFPLVERYLWRLTQPPLCRRTDGIPYRSHRLKALGNAVVPQQAFPFFEAIAQVELNRNPGSISP